MRQTQVLHGSKARLSSQAILDTLPLAIAVIPWGMLTGALAIQAGFTPVQAMFMSVFMFAGAAQLSAITLTNAGASWGAIFGSTFVISARHLLYSVVFREYVIKLPLQWRLLIAFVLTDEMFAVSQTHTQRTGQFSALYALVSGFTFHIAWSLGTLIGIVSIDVLSNLETLGFDFAIVAVFIAMTFDQIRRRPILVAVIVSGATSVICKPLLNDTYIIVAGLIGMCAAYISDINNDKISTQSATIKENIE